MQRDTCFDNRLDSGLNHSYECKAHVQGVSAPEGGQKSVMGTADAEFGRVLILIVVITPIMSASIDGRPKCEVCVLLKGIKASDMDG